MIAARPLESDVSRAPAVSRAPWMTGVSRRCRAIYTVRLRRAVYVLHVFQKKSKRGGEVPKADRALIASRLRRAEQIDREGSST